MLEDSGRAGGGDCGPPLAAGTAAAAAAVLTHNYQPTCQLQPKSENIKSQVNRKIFKHFFLSLTNTGKIFKYAPHSILNIFQDIPNFKISNIIHENFSSPCFELIKNGVISQSKVG